MIARVWRGTAAAGKAGDYHRHFVNNVAPHLKEIVGHKGSLLLQRAVDGEVEFIVITWWDAMKTIETFAGSKPEVAVVEPEAQAALSAFDAWVTHYDVAYRSDVV